MILCITGYLLSWYFYIYLFTSCYMFFMWDLLELVWPYHQAKHPPTPEYNYSTVLNTDMPQLLRMWQFFLTSIPTPASIIFKICPPQETKLFILAQRSEKYDLQFMDIHYSVIIAKISHRKMYKRETNLINLKKLRCKVYIQTLA